MNKLMMMMMFTPDARTADFFAKMWTGQVALRVETDVGST